MIGHLKALVSQHWRFRSSVSGHFVSKWYALTHPRSTEREEVKRDEGDVL